MSFRTKLLAFFTLTIIAAVTLVAWGVSVYTRRAFEQSDHDRTEALIAQFRREYAQRGDEVVHRVQGIADEEATLRMAMDLNRPQADASQYYNDAHGLAEAQQLDFLDIVADDGTLISSAEWPARFGYKTDWVASEKDWNSQGAFLRRVEMADGVDLGLMAVRAVRVGEKHVYLVGGQRLDQNFLKTLILPAGTRALLYRNLEQGFVAAALSDASGAAALPAAQTERFAPFIAEVQGDPRELERTINWGPDAASAETFDAIPLTGRQNDLLGVLLLGSSRRGLVTILTSIRSLALLVGGGVIFLTFILGWWISARVTRPIEELAAGAREVAGGRWNTRVEVRSRDEIGELAGAFNHMTRQLTEQRERLVQTERVAAWRELARRLAHELKNPLFPLQLTVENLQRAREQTSEQFDEIFFESTATLRAELENLKTIVSRFSDFAKMPAPELQKVDLNESVRGVVKLFEPQFSALGRPPITPELYLDENLAPLRADPALLRRALENLVLNALDAMPAGGTLTVRTSQRDGFARLEVTDTGAGLTPEECERLFTPYYTSKQQGTGLGLAIVQSVVSDHGGKIAVESAPGAGATFRIELPIDPAKRPANVAPVATRPEARPEVRNEIRPEVRNEVRPETRNEAPSGIRNEVPRDIPVIEAPNETANEAPSRVPEEVPEEAANEAPSGTRNESLRETPVNETLTEPSSVIPHEVPNETPSETRNGTENDVPDEAPKATQNEAPNETPVDEPSVEAATELPTELPVEVASERQPVLKNPLTYR